MWPESPWAIYWMISARRVHTSSGVSCPWESHPISLWCIGFSAFTVLPLHPVLKVTCGREAHRFTSCPNSFRLHFNLWPVSPFPPPPTLFLSFSLSFPPCLSFPPSLSLSQCLSFPPSPVALFLLLPLSLPSLFCVPYSAQRFLACHPKTQGP